MAFVRSHRTADAAEAEVHWARRWIVCLVGTALVLVAAAVIGGSMLHWMAAAATFGLGIVTLITQAVMAASSRSIHARQRQALALIRSVAAAVAALTAALLVQATVSTILGSLLAVVALLVLLGAGIAFFPRL